MSAEENDVERLRRAFTALGASAHDPAGCPDAGRIWATVAGEETPEQARAVVLHSATCAACGTALRLAREIAAGAQLDTQGGASSRRWRLALLAASLLVAAAGAWILVRGLGAPSADPWADMTIAKADYAPEDELVWRGGDAPSAPSFEQGMQAYQRDDLVRAAELLARSAETEPRPAAALFYRGVSLLLSGKSAESVAALESAERAGGPLREEACWYLARAALKAGDREKARRALDRLIAEEGKHHQDALELRNELEASGR